MDKGGKKGEKGYPGPMRRLCHSTEENRALTPIISGLSSHPVFSHSWTPNGRCFAGFATPISIMQRLTQAKS